MIFQTSASSDQPVSHDWKIFQNLFPYMGAFLYLHDREEAYLDDNTYRILHLKKETPSGKISHERFTQVMQDITRNPIAQQHQIYQYSTEHGAIRLRVSFVERDEHSWLGFVQDVTHYDAACAAANDTQGLDPLTGLYTREAFVLQMRRCMEVTSGVGYLAVLHIHGVDQLAQQYGYSQSDRCIIAVSKSLEQFQTSDVIIGVRSFKDFFVYLSGEAAKRAGTIFTQIRAAIAETVVTDDFGEVVNIRTATALSISIGYCACPTGNKDVDVLMNHACFALFEAMSERKDICAFNNDHYQQDKAQYTDLQFFRRLVGDNLFTYHYQPIVSARTGDIIGFEALMRAPDMPLSALKILEIAERNKCLYAVERATVFNCLKALSEQQEAFADKKLFINAIPRHLLTETDFDTLYATYGELLEKVVVEITEQTEVSGDIIDTIKARCATIGCEFAIDDYGAGYANTANLLLTMPNYVKIDRTLLSGIENDTKKQRLVSDIIRFCKENDIRVVAEGVETRLELRTVIRLGVDLIQGYYTSKPKPFLTRSISKTVQNEIVSFNLEMRNYENKTYSAKTEDAIELVPLALDHYTDLLVKREDLTLIGDPDSAVKMGIIIEEELDCTLTIRDVNLRAVSHPAITVGERSHLTLILEGENKLDHMGILVPDGSGLTIVGDGTLEITADRQSSFAIGNDMEHSYGGITLATGGRVQLSINGEQCVGIGGGMNPGGSEIRLLSGDISITSAGIDCVCVGNHDGNARISIQDCDLTLSADAANGVTIGAFSGSIDASISARVDIRESGNKTVGIGVLDKGTGKIDIRDSHVSVALNARYIAGIGTIDGELNTTVDSANIILNCEGSEIAGIGDTRGGGEILLKDTELDMLLFAAVFTDVGTKRGSCSIEGGRKNVRINNT